MCWSGEASVALAVVGFAGAGYACYKKEDPNLWVPLVYFSLMETLQAYTYTVIGQCSNPGNQIATLLGYIHIVFQPFFINMMSMHFIPEKIRKKISNFVYLICLISAVVMLVQLYPFEWAGNCIRPRPLCGENLCSIHGNWHIAWEVPLNGIGNGLFNVGQNVPILRPILFTGFITYVIAAFIMPVIYGAWRGTLYHILMGPLLALMTTNNMNEWPAIWCLLSIGFLLLMIDTPIRKILYVKKWFWWRFV